MRWVKSLYGQILALWLCVLIGLPILRWMFLNDFLNLRRVSYYIYKLETGFIKIQMSFLETHQHKGNYIHI